jgi:glycosyltransferase involved in cell wall biosynthesis
MARPLVSIVIPCYRQGCFLAVAVQSALGQVRVPVEVIVVNDGSDDDTESVAERFGDRIRYWRQPNRGLSAARNRGLALARGTYVLCLDADDVLDPRAAGWLVAAAAGREDVLCVMGYTCFDERQPSGSGHPGVLPPRDGRLERRLLTGNLGPPHAYLCGRRMLLASGGFDETLRWRGCEDWQAWITLVLAGATVVPVHQVGAHYRRHRDSMSGNAVEMALARAEVLHRTLRCLRRGLGGGAGGAEALRAEVRKNLARAHLDAAYWLRERGEYGAALASCVRGLGSLEAAPDAVVRACKLAPHALRRAWHWWSADRHLATGGAKPRT